MKPLVDTINTNERRLLSAEKVMSAVFWNSQGVIYIDHLQKANSAAVLYNAELLGRLEAELH